MTTNEEIRDALQKAQDSWTGCDWSHEFSFVDEDGDIDYVFVEGVTAEEARENAEEALSKEEREAWEKAAEWLKEVESDASSAEDLAEEAVDAWEAGDRAHALDLISQAARIESAYGDDPTWGPLKKIMTEAFEEGEDQEDELDEEDDQEEDEGEVVEVVRQFRSRHG